MAIAAQYGIFFPVKLQGNGFRAWYACALLAGAYPLVHFYARNAQCFTGEQILRSTGAVFLAVSAAFVLVVAWIGRRPETHAAALRSPFVMAALPAGVYLALSFQPLWNSIQARSLPLPADLLLLLAAFALISAAVRKIGGKWLSVLLLAAVGIEGGQWAFAALTQDTTTACAEVPPEHRAVYSGIRLRATPDIYFVALESYHGPQWLADFYGTDNQPFRRELESLGFHVHANVFANYCTTLASLHAAFSMRHHFYSISAGDADSSRTRDLLAGADFNPVLSILKTNGYRVEYLLGNHYLCLPEKAAGAIDATVPAESGNLAPLLALIWPYGRHAESSTMAGYRDLLLAQASAPRAAGPPRFVFLKTGLEHTPRGPHDPAAWKQKYLGLLEEENRFLSRLCRALAENNPDAIVILMGDHGAWGYASRWWTDAVDPNEYFRDNGLDPADAARDLADVFLAVRFGKEPAEPLAVRSPVNLFRELFLRLSGDGRLRALRAADDSYQTVRHQLYRCVRNAEPLATWERIPTDGNGQPRAP